MEPADLQPLSSHRGCFDSQEPWAVTKPSLSSRDTGEQEGPLQEDVLWDLFISLRTGTAFLSRSKCLHCTQGSPVDLLPHALTCGAAVCVLPHSTVLAASLCLSLPRFAAAEQTPCTAKPAGDTHTASHTRETRRTEVIHQGWSICPLWPMDRRLKPPSATRARLHTLDFLHFFCIHVFLLGLRRREPGSAADQLPSIVLIEVLLITSAPSLLGEACPNFVRARQRASKPGNHSAERCPWGTATSQPGPEPPTSFQMPMSRRQVRCSPAQTTDDCTPTPSLACHSGLKDPWLMLLQRPQKYVPKARG